MAEKEFPFDRVMVMAQVDGSWISVYIRKGFATQEEAIQNVQETIGNIELKWNEIDPEEFEADGDTLQTEANEKIKTDMPAFMKEIWDDEDTS